MVYLAGNGCFDPPESTSPRETGDLQTVNRNDLQKLADLRIKEAEVLLRNGCYEGAYYLAGYAVECALKACIAKTTQQYDFPDKDLVQKSYTHNLEKLVSAAGLDQLLKQEMAKAGSFAGYWAVVKDWSEEMRYHTSVGDKVARDMFEAITNAKDGVMRWLKRLW